MIVLLAEGERDRTEIDRGRARIAAIRTELEELDQAAMSLPEATQQIMERVRMRADSIRSGMFAGFVLPGLAAETESPRDSRLDVMALLSMLSPESFEKNLTACLKPMCSSTSRSKREARSKELTAELAKLREKDETLTLRLLAADLVVEPEVPDSVADCERLMKLWDSPQARQKPAAAS